MKDDIKCGYRFSLRFNLNHPDHQRAWDKINSISNGKRSDYLVQAILAFGKPDTETLVKTLVSAVTDEIKSYIDERLDSASLPSSPANRKQKQKKHGEAVSKDVLDFMKGL